jgi:hypothetical protein
VAYEGIEPVEDPFTELSKLAGEVLAYKRAISSRVASLEAIRYSSAGSGAEQLRAELGLLERAQDRSGRLLSVLISSDFEARRTRLAESQGVVAGEAIRQILDRMLEKVLGVLDDDEDRAQLRARWAQWVSEVVPPVLRGMRGDPPAIAGRVLP